MPYAMYAAHSPTADVAMLPSFLVSQQHGGCLHMPHVGFLSLPTPSSMCVATSSHTSHCLPLTPSIPATCLYLLLHSSWIVILSAHTWYCTWIGTCLYRHGQRTKQLACSNTQALENTVHHTPHAHTAPHHCPLPTTTHHYYLTHTTTPTCPTLGPHLVPSFLSFWV